MGMGGQPRGLPILRRTLRTAPTGGSAIPLEQADASVTTSTLPGHSTALARRAGAQDNSPTPRPGGAASAHDELSG
jgi:hypothetical protein